MLPKENRFTSVLFQRLFRRSKRWNSGDFSFLYSPAKGKPRYAVVSSKKYIKSAVGRNRIRRQIYEAMHKVFLDSQTEFNVICLYNSAQELQDAQRLEQVLAELLSFLQKK